MNPFSNLSLALTITLTLLSTTITAQSDRDIYPAVRSPPCNEYETYQSCGSACHPTCATAHEEQTVCTLQCVIGCFCQDGLLRTESGSCVPLEECSVDDDEDGDDGKC
ncbi:hypothetical protein BDV18DRAFT_112899 [Aspergillus unguis]